MKPVENISEIIADSIKLEDKKTDRGNCRDRGMDMKNLLSSMPSKSKEKILAEIHKRAKSIRVSEVEIQRMIEHAKEKKL